MASKIRDLSDNKAFNVEHRNGVIFIAALGDKQFKLDLTIPANNILAVHIDGNKVNISTIVVDRYHAVYMLDYRQAEGLKEAIDNAMVQAFEFLHCGRNSSVAVQSNNATLPRSPKEAKSS